MGKRWEAKMKKLTKSQLKKIAAMHAGVVLLATESTWAFGESNLSHSEIEYLDNQFEKIASKYPVYRLKTVK